jgi:hypothetical protein
MAQMFMEKMHAFWEFASRRVAGFYNTRSTLTQNTFRKDNVIPIFEVLSGLAIVLPPTP